MMGSSPSLNITWSTRNSSNFVGRSTGRSAGFAPLRLLSMYRGCPSRELFRRVGFIVTALTGTNRAVVRFYNQRGTAEQ